MTISLSAPLRSRHPCMPGSPATWLFLGLMWCVVQVLLPIQGIVVTGTHPVILLVAALLFCSCLVRGLSGRDKSVSVFLECLAIFFCTAAVYGPLSYIVTRSPFPSVDPYLRHLDLALGVDPLGWRQAIDRSWGLRWFHLLAYDSLIPQTILALLVLSRVGDGRRSYGLLGASLLALTVASLVAYRFPAEGTLPGAESWAADWNVLHASRRPFVTTAAHIDGIISFPSFHAVMAVVLAWSMRGLGWASCVFAALNVAMLASTPPIGCHYLLDLAAGIGLAACCIGIVQGAGNRSGAGVRSGSPALEHRPHPA